MPELVRLAGKLGVATRFVMFVLLLRPVPANSTPPEVPGSVEVEDEFRFDPPTIPVLFPPGELSAAEHAPYTTTALLHPDEVRVPKFGELSHLRRRSRLGSASAEDQYVALVRLGLLEAASMRRSLDIASAKCWRRANPDDPICNCDYLAWNENYYAPALIPRLVDARRASHSPEFDRLVLLALADMVPHRRHSFLREFLATYPGSPEADRVRLWLGDQAMLSRRFAEARALYAEISSGGTKSKEAAHALVHDLWTRRNMGQVSDYDHELREYVGDLSWPEIQREAACSLRYFEQPYDPKGSTEGCEFDGATFGREIHAAELRSLADLYDSSEVEVDFDHLGEDYEANSRETREGRFQ